MYEYRIFVGDYGSDAQWIERVKARSAQEAAASVGGDCYVERVELLDPVEEK